LEVIVVTTGSARLVLTRWTGFMLARRACLKVSWGALALWTRSAVVKLSRGALSLGTVAVSWRAFT
jgi:hypothetical protein